MLVLGSTVAIAVCCLVADDFANTFVFKDDGHHKFLFGLLPALNDKRKPVPNTELIKMSRGFVCIMILAFVVGIVACFFESNQFRRASGTLTSFKIVAILSLLIMTLVSIPRGISHNILDGNFDSMKYGSTGTDLSAANCLFYLGILAFSEGIFTLKVPAIASSHRRTNLPLASALIAGAVTRWLFCVMGSLIL